MFQNGQGRYLFVLQLLAIFFTLWTLIVCPPIEPPLEAEELPDAEGLVLLALPDDAEPVISTCSPTWSVSLEVSPAS